MAASFTLSGETDQPPISLCAGPGLLLGSNFPMHLLVRLPKLVGFQACLVKQFAGTALPAALLGPYAAVLPFVEGDVRVLLSLFTLLALVEAMLVMMSLVFDSSLLEP